MEDFDPDFMDSSAGKIYQIQDKSLAMFVSVFSSAVQKNREEDPVFMLANLIKDGENFPGELFDAAIVAISNKVKYDFDPETGKQIEIGADNETVNMIINNLYNARVEVGGTGRMAKKINPFAVRPITANKYKEVFNLSSTRR